MEVVTLNCWGLWLVSKKRPERMRAIATALAASKADVVLLQEVWVDADARDLQAAAKSAGLAHGVHFRSGMFGSGLVTLSRHPVRQMGFWRFAAGGCATDVHHGDYHAGKGVGWVRIAAPGGDVDVLNTHTHANYSHEYVPPPPAARRNPLLDAGALVPGDGDAPARLAQIIELAQLCSVVAGVAPGSAAPGARPMVLGGDLNFKPGTLESNLWRQMVPWLRDAWEAAAERDAEAANPDGLTCKAPGNTFASYKQVPERIDYVWTDLPCARAAVALTHKTAGGVSLSDHFAVSVRLTPGGPRQGERCASPTRLGGLFGGRGGSSAAAAGAAKAPSPAAAAGVAEPAARTALFGAAALLEQGIYSSSADAGLKVAIGGCMVVSVLYSAVALPTFMPWVVFQGWRLALALVLASGLTLLGVLLALAGRVADMSQQRALSNAYKQLRAFVDAHGIVLVPEDEAAAARAAGASAVERPK